MRYSVLSLNSTLINYEGDSIFLNQYQFLSKLNFIYCFYFWSWHVKFCNLEWHTCRQLDNPLFWSGNAGGGGGFTDERKRRWLELRSCMWGCGFSSFFIWGIGWKSISFTSSYFLHVHGPCGLQFFLYETQRSKLNLFIQISLNATPTKKKSQAQHICIP